MPAPPDTVPWVPPLPFSHNEPAANYLLIDGVLMKDALVALPRLHGIAEVLPIYQGTRFEPCNDIGPFLVNIAPYATPEQVLEQIHDWPGNTSLLYSSASSFALRTHLQSFVSPPMANGLNGLLRFAEPLVTHYWLRSYQPWELDAVLGPIEAWQVLDTPHAWLHDELPQWYRVKRTSSQAVTRPDHNHLGQQQLDTLDQAARWRFREQLYAYLQEHFPDHLAQHQGHALTQWFDRCLDAAEQWGLTSRRSLVTWIEHSLRWGEGFIHRPDSPYQRWLAQTPNALKLTPQQRIEQMDTDCQDIELDKELS